MEQLARSLAFIWHDDASQSTVTTWLWKNVDMYAVSRCMGLVSKGQ